MIVSCGYAQVDTEFWFAPPEVTSGHGDRPVYLRISTLNHAAVVQVLQPGRQNVVIATANVSGNTTQTIDLTTQLDNLETNRPAEVMKTGIRITSSAPITAYYEVGAPFNSDIFALKGRNGLGSKFVIPAQNFYHNSADYFPRPSSSFDIVASQNNTVIKVRPTKPIVGHIGDTLITVKLNAGETYSFRKVTLLASDNPAGTIVESNKPIAITIKDDSVINGGCRDMLGDQLVPVEVAGTEYVVVKGFLQTQEFMFITATADDTKIFISGSASPVATLSAGEMYRHQISLTSTYVHASKTIYVFHVTGFGCEMGLAILPSINCKGSPQIGFTRTTSEFFGLNILVRKEGIRHFILNGSSASIPAGAFFSVAGTNDEWYAAQLSFGLQQIPVGQASLISNAVHSFQVGIINGNAASTCRYGYFSSFSSLFIGDDVDICEGSEAILDAGPGKESYLWSTGETSEKIIASNPGEYWVKIVREECVLYDTIQVHVKKGNLDIGPDQEICEGDTTSIDGKENFSWLWSDGGTDQYLKTKEAGKYWVSVFDYTGCVASDTILVSLKDIPAAELGEDVLKCKTEPHFVDATFPGATYLWNDGITSGSRNIKAEGLYSVNVFWNGCAAADSILIENLPGPSQDSIFGSPSVCPYSVDVGYAVEAIPQSTYQWFVEGGVIKSTQLNSITVDWHGASNGSVVKAVVTDWQGCGSDTLLYPVRINVELLVEMPDGPDTLCLNKSQQIVYTTPVTNGSIYEWKVSGGEILDGQGTPNVVINWTEGLHQLWIEEMSTTIDTVCRGTSAQLPVYVYEDLTSVTLNFVSVDTAKINSINIAWAIDHPGDIQNNELLLYKTIPPSADSELLATLIHGETAYEDRQNFWMDNTYQYFLALTNSCYETLRSAVHTTMLLTGNADTTTGNITLRWNHYVGWPDAVIHYEVWRKLDNEPGYRYMVSIPGSENSFLAPLASDGFEHRYVVRALENGGPSESWSTALTLEFEHNITIPNIITPNGDEFNQYFNISKIELYKQSDLTILDRWGKQIYRVIHYQNDWDGNGLSSGVYYYVLDLKRNGRVYKGTVSILK